MISNPKDFLNRIFKMESIVGKLMAVYTNAHYPHFCGKVKHQINLNLLQ